MKNILNRLPVARPGLIFVFISAAIFLICLVAEMVWLRSIFFLVTVYVIWFFRDPERPVPPEGFGLAPADGRVIAIEDVPGNPYTNAPAKKVSIFMSLFNVHVNRIPISGRLNHPAISRTMLIISTTLKRSLNMKQNIIIEGMSCGHCTGSVEKALKGIAGVSSVKVDLASKTAVIDSNQGIAEELLKSTISDLGFSVTALSQG